jgi:predicted outer membrane lipoprotein/TM2 domain-containing membrane protein YozV
MKKSVKAALLSGLVFPGMGHLYLKRWVAGVLLAGVAGYTLYAIVAVALAIALDVSQQIERGAIPADLDTVNHIVAQQLSGSAQATELASFTLLACWVFGIISAFWQGRVQDRHDAQITASRSG